MKQLISLLIFMLVPASFYAQNINGRVSSSLYAFERFDTLQASANYLRAYELLALNVNYSRFSLRTSMNFESDLAEKLTNDPRFRMYNFYLEARDLFDVATIKLGRQPLFNTIGGGLFDGADVKIKYDNYKLNLFYGANTPAYQKFELIDNWSDNNIYGADFSAAAFDYFRFDLGYINKNYKPQDYLAQRLDENLNPITVLIQNKSNQYEYAYAGVNFTKEKMLTVNTRFEYDINFEEMSKFEVNAEYDQLEKVKFDLYYNYREPRIRYNSIFSVFDYGNTQEIEAGADYIIDNNFTVTAKVADVEYKDDNSQRVTLGFMTNYGNITYRKNLGYAGEMDAVSLYAAHTFLEGLLTPSAGISFTNYKLSEDAETNNLTTLLLGVNVRPFRTLSFDVQGQYMDNKIYKNDYRFFFNINYWFNANL